MSKSVNLKLHKSQLWEIWSAVMAQQLKQENQLRSGGLLKVDGEPKKSRTNLSSREKEALASYRRTERLWGFLDDEIEKILRPTKPKQGKE